MKAHIINKKDKPGKWQSPITPEWLGERLRLGDAQWDEDGKGLFWVENLSGFGHLRQLRADKKLANISLDVDVGGRIGYGGGDFCVAKNFLIFAGKNGCLYRRDVSDKKVNAITPPWGKMAAPAVSPNQQWVMFVYSDGETDLIGVVNSRGYGWPAQLVRGSDFYLQPIWHPGGDMIAWMEWDHPYLPWQAGRIKLGEVGGMQLRLFGEKWVAGSPQTPASQPQFSPDGKWLSFIQANGEWDELVLFNLSRKTRRILIGGEGVFFGLPGWVQGERNYGWSHDSQKIFFRQVKGGQASLWEAKVKTGTRKQLNLGPFQWLSQISVNPTSEEILLRASSPRHPQQLVRIKDGHIQPVVKPMPIGFSDEFLPQAKALEWKAEDGSIVHGLYWAPSNPHYELAGIPPLLVEMHGGPTSHTPLVFSPERAFFTSRGFVILSVDYRGSTGYGRSYQESLRGQWGIVDVEDAVSGAQAMVRQGLAFEEQIAIIGSSAGGFSVLNALIHFPGVFKAGVCAYPVCNLIEDAQQTHKLERHYNEYLVGDAKDMTRYKARSPVYHADKIRDPIAIFHGENDPVVPVDQSRQIVEILKRNQTPHLFKVYEGEGHGFRKAETLMDYYQQILKFLDQHLLK